MGYKHASDNLFLQRVGSSLRYQIIYYALTAGFTHWTVDDLSRALPDTNPRYLRRVVTRLVGEGMVSAHEETYRFNHDHPKARIMLGLYHQTAIEAQPDSQ